jgi:hypothetical protein
VQTERATRHVMFLISCIRLCTPISERLYRFFVRIQRPISILRLNRTQYIIHYADADLYTPNCRIGLMKMIEHSANTEGVSEKSVNETHICSWHTFT